MRICAAPRNRKLMLAVEPFRFGPVFAGGHVTPAAAGIAGGIQERPAALRVSADLQTGGVEGGQQVGGLLGEPMG